jgi:pentatricopeptide repeat domain-containing protein 1
VQAFEQMQQANCRPDSCVYQHVIDVLWSTGIAWAQARAAQLYAMAARSFRRRFAVQADSSASSSRGAGCRECVMPACLPGVGVLALHSWLVDLAAQVQHDPSNLLWASQGGARLALTLGRSRHAREPSSSDTPAAVLGVLSGLNAALFRCVAPRVVPARSRMRQAVAPHHEAVVRTHAHTTLLCCACDTTNPQARQRRRDGGWQRGGG